MNTNLKNFYFFFICFTFSISTGFSAQNTKNKANYTYEMRGDEGDLNNDGKPDKVSLKMDTINETTPFELQIYLSQPNGKLKLVVSSDQIVQAMYPDGKNITKLIVPDLFIEEGILKYLLQGRSGYKSFDFKYQNGNFELVKMSKLSNNSTKGYVNEFTIFTQTEFDLLTGIRTEVDDRLGEEKIIEKRTKTVIVRPLPKIQDLKYSDFEKY